jgi:hypothetical protein
VHASTAAGTEDDATAAEEAAAAEGAGDTDVGVGDLDSAGEGEGCIGAAILHADAHGERPIFVTEDVTPHSAKTKR